VGRCNPVGVLRCLIVDDSPSFLEAATNLLQREGIDVLAVTSTTDGAVQRTKELKPDVVLVDIFLGSESGFDLARRLAEIPDVKVILISTHSGSDFADLIADSQVAGFVPKSELSAAAIRRLVEA
jgi:DNA-binding NarL/FixJ family response regulator